MRGGGILTVFSFPESSIPFVSRPTKYVHATYGNIGHVFCILVHWACILFQGNIVHIYLEQVSTNVEAIYNL